MMPLPSDRLSDRIIVNENLSSEDLQEFMDTHGISRKELSEIFGITTQAISLWLTGGRYVSVTNTRLIRLFIKYPNLIREF